MVIGNRRVVEIRTPPGPCSRSGEMTTGGGCGVPIDGVSVAEVVAAAHQAIRQHTAHEVDEWFLYRGARPFDPHA